MAANLAALIEQLETNAKSGVALPDQTVLRALRVPEIAKKLQKLLDGGYALISASATPSSMPELAQVVFRLNPPAGTAWLAPPCVVGTFETATGVFVSVSNEISAASAEAGDFGALPFTLATKSFTQAAAVRGDDPTLRGIQTRRAQFDQRLGGGGPGARSHTVEACPYDTPYGTSDKTTQYGQDWDTATDYSRDWENDYSVDP